jgi:hypothetical protein
MALKAAQTAYDLTSGTNSAILDTYARALFDSGKVADAIRMQKKAIETCQDNRGRINLEATLKTYQKNADQ